VRVLAQRYPGRRAPPVVGAPRPRPRRARRPTK
jgi:hypothetical protein